MVRLRHRCAGRRWHRRRDTFISNEAGESGFSYGADNEMRIERDVNPGTNHGVVLISTNDDSTRITTSEGTPAADRPVLTVTFVP